MDTVNGRETETAAIDADITGRTVLVTGGAGFVGSHLARALVRDNEVRVLDDCSTGQPDNVPGDATLYEGDLLDEGLLQDAIDGVDLVFHEAGLVSVPKSVECPVESNRVNVAGTLAVLEAARSVDARVVLASSVAIYGDPETVPVDESHPTRPTSPYATDKLAIDHYARVYHERYGLETVSLRYFNVYGPGQSTGSYAGVVSTFLEQVRSGQPITVEGDGSQTRDFVHVADVVRANLAAATTEHVGEAFNIGTGDSVTIRELAELIADVAGATAGITHVHPRPGDVERSRADISKARRLLGFEPSVDLHTGIAELASRQCLER
ncbi:NAD-dependent epimerase/dehydratase family protein [Halobaculum magnesiiphilum]|uniref:NAD-dependent epimerase/dehydratase family protein n=1 Tax=Halobaculum magnesiiphilum TaxID=1017351 RepID=A0A8T8WIZ3_9EURY|nr:NAD-dependent epimerase/dehydratase family protein [Halobaculum magnesiiphilum]QZP39704.1 NAD-dependent epimerase/dehydratase family protein [Halobaculum magnesiiphilum]